MKSMMWKTTIREIIQSFGRYMAILGIVALGVGFFAGIKVAKSAMVKTTENYYKETSFFDFQLISSLGFEEEDVEYLNQLEEIGGVEGTYTFDVIYSDKQNVEGVIKALTVTENVNNLKLVAGRMPENPNECVVDSQLYVEEEIGEVISIAPTNTDTDRQCFTYEEYTIVGIVQSPLYIQFERGNTSLLNGTINGFMYLLKEGFSSDIFTEIYVKFNENFDLYSEEYTTFIEQKKIDWDIYTETVALRRYHNILTEANKELDDAIVEFEEEKTKAEQELADARKELDDGLLEIIDAKKEIEVAKKKLVDGKNELVDAEQELLDGEAELAEKEAELAQGEAELQDAITQWYGAKYHLSQGGEEVRAAEEELSEQEQGLLYLYGGVLPEEVQTMLNIAKNEIENGKAQLAEAQKQIDVAGKEINDGKAEIENGKIQLEKARIEIGDGWIELEEAKVQVHKGEKELADGIKKLADAEKELADGEKEYEEGYQEFLVELADAEKKLAEARAEIDDLSAPDTYVLGRNTNVGYVCFENDSSIVEGIANVFPVFFFLVAALVCITTMNRMVEEQRTQIGTMKALGYSRNVIMFKYVIYSGSAAMIGCIMGFLIGTYFFPKVIWTAYGMMYRVDNLIYIFNFKLAIIAIVVSLICSIGTTLLSCRNELAEVAAQLMRPKTPKAGKRVIFEYIPFLWNQLSFLYKVSIRNVLRYKKRFFMMVIGISGCTALVLTGFGIKDSIADVGKHQYEIIQTYDLSVSFRNKITTENTSDFQKIIEKEADLKYLTVLESKIDLHINDNIKSVTLIVPETIDNFDNFVVLQTMEEDPIAFPKEGEVVIGNKIAEEYNINIGDQIILVDEDRKNISVKVSGITQNFINNFVYIHPDTYTSQLNEEVSYKTIYLDINKEISNVHSLSAELLNVDDINNISINSDMLDRFSSMMSSLDYIVIVVIGCAAMLAFIVLYNLTNINITERIREIATIKVLGFQKNETSSYVFRENTILTFCGALVGIFLGKWLHSFVMSEIKVDMVSFYVKIKAESYIYSFLLTFVFAWFVNIIMSKKLEKISMTESLKSID